MRLRQFISACSGQMPSVPGTCLMVSPGHFGGTLMFRYYMFGPAINLIYGLGCVLKADFIYINF